MWAKICTLIGVLTLVQINGLQNDLDTGYLYNQPHQESSSTIQASLAYYVNIPAHRNAADHFYLISNSKQYKETPPPPYERTTLKENSINNGLRDFAFRQLSPSRNINSLNAMDSTGRSVYPYHQPSFLREASDYNSLALTNYQKNSGYRIHQSIEEILPPKGFNHFRNQDYQRMTIPSQKLIPPSYTPHVTLQIDTKSYQGYGSNKYRLVPSRASIPMSFNAQLPFPIGVVPIKFSALPLKTHLREEGLLPITSYEARESYKKK